VFIPRSAGLAMAAGPGWEVFGAAGAGLRRVREVSVGAELANRAV